MLLKKLRLLPLLLIIALTALVVSAQDGRILIPGTPVSGQLDSANFVQVYTYSAAAGTTLTVQVSNTLGIPLAVTVTDSAGTLIAQAFDDAVTGSVTLDAPSANGGTYYVTVFKAGGVSSAADVPFTVVASASEAAATPEVIETSAPQAPTPETTSSASDAGGQLLTTTGMVINLSWGSISDLDLEVRDPVGGSLYFQTPTVTSGGTLGPNVNQGCANTTSNALESATWSPGGIPTGSYEVIVYYQQGCEGETTPVEFSLAATVDGLSLGTVDGTMIPGQVFVTSLVVNSDGNAGFTGLSGIVDDQVLPDTAANIIASAVPLSVGSAINGTLSTQNPYDAYTFVVQANDFISISLSATSGSLDTFVLLLDPQGNIVRSNDDLADGVTNSQISGALLTEPGTYTIVATRYGKRVGGTEGTYTLSLSAQVTNLPEEFLNLPRGVLEFTLLWDTDDDLQLLVRDPAGQAVFDDSPTIRSGGTLAANGNVNCVPATTTTPFSYTYWPTEPRPGIYEIEVWFQNECATVNPVNFNLLATYNGREIFNVSAEPILGERYLISFTLNPDGTTTLSDGGIIAGLTSLPYQAEIENAISLTGTLNGSITQDNKFDLYLFDAEAGDLITVSMNATSGTLDPTLYLVGPFGNLIAENDDTVSGENINSLIPNLTLPETGRYIIIATHFGALYGGTTGTYSVTLTQLN